MNNRLIALLSCAVLVTACGQGQGPETTSDLPIRYAVVNLADINTAALGISVAPILSIFPRPRYRAR